MEARTPIYAGIRFFQNIVFRADLFFQIFQFGKIPPKRFIYGNNFFAKFPRKYFACHAWKNSVHVIGVCGKTYIYHKMHGIPHGTLPVGWIVFWFYTSDAFRIGCLSYGNICFHGMLFRLVMRCRRSSRGPVMGFKKATILTGGLFVGLQWNLKRPLCCGWAVYGITVGFKRATILKVGLFMGL